MIVALNPTRGLDVRSALAARLILLAARDGGAAVLLISEDLDELRALSDRLVVLFRGRVVAGGRPQELDLSEKRGLLRRRHTSGLQKSRQGWIAHRVRGDPLRASRQ
jgi:simple sugar transport system ATP-binding protein